MTVKFVQFEKGVLLLKEIGRLDAADAKQYEQIVYEYANIHPRPIVVLVDAREVEVVMPDATQGMVRAGSIDNVKLHIIATEGLVVTQAANILALRNPTKNTLIFENWQDAVDYAYEQGEDPAYS